MWPKNIGPAIFQARRALSDLKMKAPLRVATSSAIDPVAGFDGAGVTRAEVFMVLVNEIEKERRRGHILSPLWK
jgi:hypothetical protein